MGSIQPLFRQPADETVASEMEVVGIQMFCQKTRKTCLDGFYGREVFRVDEVEEWSVFKKLKLPASMMLRQKVVRDRLKRFDAEH